MQPSKVRSRAKVSTIVMWILLATMVLLIPATLAAPWVVGMAKPGVMTPSMAPLMIVVGLSMCLVGVGQMAAYVTFVVFFCMWVHAANRAAWAAGNPGMEFTPGWAVGWWFIPFANLVMPFRMMTELWKASDPWNSGQGNWRAATVPSMIGLWWATWLVGNFLSSIGGMIGKVVETDGGLWVQTWMQVVGTVFLLVAGGMLLTLIRQITDRLTTRTGGAV